MCLQSADSSGNNTQSGTTITHDNVTAGMCSPVKYTGEACAPYLLSYQNCLPAHSSSNDSVIYISSTVEQSRWENGASSLLGLKYLVPKPCQDKLIPFLCLYFFNLCNKETGTLLKPSSQQCVELRDKVCATNWKRAMKIDQFAHLIPNCDSLPHDNENKLVDTCNSSQRKNIFIVNVMLNLCHRG